MSIDYQIFQPMKRRAFLRASAKLSSLMGLSLLACRDRESNAIPSSTGTMKLESTAFSSETLIPLQYTCDGDNFSPPLTWDEVPPNTQSLVLICDDPDAPTKTWVHWVVYNLPSQTRSLPENIPAQASLSGGGVHGSNDFGNLGYGGPCPPKGTHRYFFKLYALDTQLDLKTGATKPEVEAAMSGHILAQTELIGHYSRK